MHHVSVLVVAEGLLDEEARQVGRDALLEPEVRALLCGDEAAVELLGDGLGGEAAGGEDLVDDGGGVEEVGAHDGQGDEAAPARAKGEENLDGCVSPDLENINTKKLSFFQSSQK